MTEVCQTLLMVFVTYGQGRIQGGRMRGMHPPTNHFQKYFCCKQFFHYLEPLRSIAISLTYALSTHNGKCANKMHQLLFGEVAYSKLRSKNLNKICLKIIQKALK